jgi:hypothetical protein
MEKTATASAHTWTLIEMADFHCRPESLRTFFLSCRDSGADMGEVEALIVGLVFAGATGVAYGLNKAALTLLLRAMAAGQTHK